MHVYKTTNLINNKIYIGISRKNSSSNASYLGSGKALKRAVAKYGKDSFKKEILAENPEFIYSDIQKLEISMIELFDSRNPLIGYNISKGGDGNDGEVNGMFGKNHSQESINKIIETRAINSKGNPSYGKMSQENSKKISKFMSERNKLKPTLPNGHSEETVNKISKTMKQLSLEGRLHKNHAKFTEERKEKYSELFSGENNPMYGKKHTPEAIQKLKQSMRLRFPAVDKVDFEGNTIKTYGSITDVTLDGYRPDLVKKVIKGDNKSHAGFNWKLKNELTKI